MALLLSGVIVAIVIAVGDKREDAGSCWLAQLVTELIDKLVNLIVDSLAEMWAFEREQTRG